MNPYEAVTQEMNIGTLQCGGGVGTRSRMCHGVWGGRQVGQMLLYIYENSNRQVYGILYVCGAFMYNIYVLIYM